MSQIKLKIFIYFIDFQGRGYNDALFFEEVLLKLNWVMDYKKIKLDALYFLAVGIEVQDSVSIPALYQQIELFFEKQYQIGCILIK